MTALLSLLASKAGTYLIGAGVIIAAFVATYLSLASASRTDHPRRSLDFAV